jgi:hypothetical protein
VNALASPEVGDYLNQHFVSSFQKVGTFRVVGNTKQGGNVMSYFCTPGGNILDAIAGPVDAATLLREARWVVQTRELGLLSNASDQRRYEMFWRQAHAARYQQKFGLADMTWQRVPLSQPTTAKVASLLTMAKGRGIDPESRIHLLLATYPLLKLSDSFRPMYEDLVNEQVSTLPVSTAALCR